MDLILEASAAARDIREASTAAARDEGGTRDLWERFGQVAPPPPRTLVVVKRPQPMRRSDGSKSVALHPSEAASYCDSYNAGGELYLRLSDGGPDESSGWIFRVVADAGVPAGGGDVAPAGGFVAFLAGVYNFATDILSVLIVIFLITFFLMLVIETVRAAFSFVCGIGVLAPILGAIRAAVDAVVASPPFKLVLCVLYAFGPEDIKESSPGNIALREQLAKDGSSAETIETTMIVHRGICMGWGVAEIFLSLLGVTLLMKVCRYFTPEPASWMVW